jgi:hypothetical protein
MWSKTAYWIRGAVICMPLGILFWILLVIFEKQPDSLLTLIIITLFGGIISGILVGGLIGSVFDLIKNKNVTPLIIFAIIIILLLLSRAVTHLFCCGNR